MEFDETVLKHLMRYTEPNQPEEIAVPGSAEEQLRRQVRLAHLERDARAAVAGQFADELRHHLPADAVAAVIAGPNRHVPASLLRMERLELIVDDAASPAPLRQ